MGKRVIAFFCVYTLMFVSLTGWLMNVTFSERYVAAGNTQSMYTLNVYSTRGHIYDRNMNVIAGGASEYKAIVRPSTETTALLLNSFDSGKLVDLEDKIKGNRPFLMNVSDTSIECEDIEVIKCEKRYSNNNPIAQNVVGYLNSEGKGASGIERAYDDILSEYSGSYKITYRVNALGDELEMTPIIRDTTDISNGGVVLTLDSTIQIIAQRAAEEYLKSGAIVIMDPNTGEILACISAPQFNQNKIVDYLDNGDAPLVNKALASYDVGSIFKLVVASAALENNLGAFEYTCTGSIEVGNKVFKCNSTNGHGTLNMEQATALSCNAYFISLGQMLGDEPILNKAKQFGFGNSIELGKKYFTSSGNLPDESELSLPAGLANFSFGQGTLLANPIQIAALISCIANGGEYIYPYIVEKTVNSKLETVSVWQKSPSYKVLDEDIAEKLKKFMESTMNYGTGKSVASQRISAGAKTGSAETGVLKNGKYLTRGWFAGYFPADNPQFVCVIIEEDAVSGTVSAGPCFRFLSERLSTIYGK